VLDSVIEWLLELGYILSEIEDVNGTEPVSRTIIIPSVNRVIPNDLEKYSSNTGFDQWDSNWQFAGRLTGCLTGFRREDCYNNCGRYNEWQTLQTQPGKAP
jgi:hypothetical protein